MILVDANLLLYAKVADYPQHPRAAACLEARLNAPERVGLPWPSLLVFLRLIAAITQGEVIRKILRHLKLAVDPPPIAAARVRPEAFAWSAA